MIVFDAMTGKAIALEENGKIRHPYTIGDMIRLVDVVVYENGKRIVSNHWDEELLVESAADMMILGSSAYKDKKIFVIKLSEWKRGVRVEIPKPFKCFVCGKLTCRGDCDEDTFLGLI
jgi:predicted dinucleotide-utilizing enzyme